jgi:colanic acid/amylovoran biosynthesis glycosyltransferase
VKVGYLVNQYPKVSHTFVRREIHALEDLGVDVARFTVRRVDEPLEDAADRSEAEKTRVILDEGARGLARGLLRTALKRPRAFASAARKAVRLGLGSDRGLLVHAAYLAEACVLAEWLDDAGVTHVHAHFGTNPATVAMLCRDLGGPTFSFTVHGPEEFDKPEAIHLEEKIRAARFVAGVSSFGRSQLFRRARARDWEKIHVVRCGLDPSLLEAVPTPVPDVPRLVCVGRLCEQKGQVLLVEAVARLHAEGAPVELVLVGDGELRGEIEAAIARHGIGANVRITGWASGDVVRRELLAARAMALPSFAEGLPVVIMEALALSRPVLSTYVAGIPELVEPGASGFLVPAGSIEALVEGLREVLRTDVDTLGRLAAEGRRRVLAMHDASVSAQVLKDLFAGEAP